MRFTQLAAQLIFPVKSARFPFRVTPITPICDLNHRLNARLRPTLMGNDEEHRDSLRTPAFLAD